MRKLKTQKGITLVALIITIVVLLILAAVAIGAVRNSDIIGYAQNAADSYETEKGKENEAIKGAEDLLSQYANGGKVDVEAQFAKFKENPEDFKHPEQSTTNGARAIGTDGTAVNMDWWKYTVIDESNKEIALSDMSGSFSYYSYYGDIENGEIVGTVPQYIKPAESNDIYTVTSMEACFGLNAKLEIAPKIPNSVKNMDDTFLDCHKLKVAPIIPVSVTSMADTFMNCKSLTEAPIIPENVTDMPYAFDNCTNLIGTLRIESTNLTNVNRLIYGTKINKIQVPANSNTETSIRAIYGSDPNITIETFEVEE